MIRAMMFRGVYASMGSIKSIQFEGGIDDFNTSWDSLPEAVRTSWETLAERTMAAIDLLNWSEGKN